MTWMTAHADRNETLEINSKNLVIAQLLSFHFLFIDKMTVWRQFCLYNKAAKAKPNNPKYETK